jgi:hypothetical protein
MQITFVYIDDPAQSEEEKTLRRKALVVTVGLVAERKLRGEKFEAHEPRLKDVGAMLVKERVGYLLCQFP